MGKLIEIAMYAALLFGLIIALILFVDVGAAGRRRRDREGPSRHDDEDV